MSLFLSSYSVKSVVPADNFDHDVILERVPSVLARLLGAKTSTMKFRGNCTVWHQHPSGKRPGTAMESLIAQLVVGYQMQTNG
jgi:hypothetical protein